MSLRCAMGFHDLVIPNGAQRKHYHDEFGFSAWAYDRVCVRCGKCQKAENSPEYLAWLERVKRQKAKRDKRLERERLATKMWEDGCHNDN